MWKIILGIIGIALIMLFYSAYASSYTPLSKQIDVRTMSLTSPQHIILSKSSCSWSCRNYSSSSSYGWSSSWGK